MSCIATLCFCAHVSLVLYMLSKCTQLYFSVSCTNVLSLILSVCVSGFTCFRESTQQYICVPGLHVLYGLHMCLYTCNTHWREIWILTSFIFKYWSLCVPHILHRLLKIIFHCQIIQLKVKK